MTEKRWCVVGGLDKGGIIVRDGKELTSLEASLRLATGALVQQEELIGDRLSFTKLQGEGPATGWVSVKIKEKVLMEEAPVFEPQDIETGRSAGVSFADVAAPVPASRKIRVLCLHGTASTDNVLRQQLTHLTRLAADDVEFVFQSGPVECDLQNPIVAQQVELMSKYFPGETFKQWAHPLGEAVGWRRYDGWDNAVQSGQDALKQWAPIDAVLGFSQGSNLAHALAAQASTGNGIPLRCVVHMCTSKPGWVAQSPELFTYKINVPALVIKGEKDTTALGSDEIASSYATVERASHPDVHRPLPGKLEEARALADVIRSFLIRQCRE